MKSKHIKITIPALFLLLILIPSKLYAEQPIINWPVDCEINESCWIIHYVDVDPSKNSKDYTCGNLTYNEHKGTDIAIKNLYEFRQGTDVLATANGTVLRIRNNAPDVIFNKAYLEQLKTSKKQECGNGLIIDHGDGWTTQYCHMKKGSIIVSPGNTVTTGQKIGQIGMSGVTEFPHLHMTVRHEGTVIDPFTGKTMQDNCGQQKNSLWDKNLNIEYNPSDFLDYGFMDSKPIYQSILNGSPQLTNISATSPILTFWVVLYGVHKDDKITLKIYDPNKNIYAEKEIIQPKDRIRQFYYIGKSNKNKPLTPGIYKAEATLTRNDPLMLHNKRHIQSNLTVNAN